MEKLKLERLLEMGGGYVLDFSNRSLREFILDNVGIDIYDEKYDYASGSKANRLRAFWSTESNYMVSQLVSALLEYWRFIDDSEKSENDKDLYEECRRIAERLEHDSIGEHLDAIQAYSDDEDFSLLAKAIRDSILNNSPQAALDRLHTFVVRYVRQQCDKHGIGYRRTEPLHSLFAKYVKYLTSNDLIEAQMTERILKSAISFLESFNRVRNDQSFAHDNPVLNYDESLLIFETVASTIRFIESVEGNQEEEPDDTGTDEIWDIPF